MKENLRTAKHVDDINLTGTEKEIDAYVKIVEATFGEVKLNKHSYTCVGVRQQKLADGSVQLDQDEYI